MLPTSGATHRNLSFFDGNLVISALKTRGFVPRTAPTTAGWQWCGASWGDWLSVWKMTPHIFLYISSWCSTISPHHWMGVREHLQETSIDISRENHGLQLNFSKKKPSIPFPTIFLSFSTLFQTFSTHFDHVRMVYRHQLVNQVRSPWGTQVRRPQPGAPLGRGPVGAVRGSAHSRWMGS